MLLRGPRYRNVGKVCSNVRGMGVRGIKLVIGLVESTRTNVTTEGKMTVMKVLGLLVLIIKEAQADSQRVFNNDIVRWEL
jgi:hypothetical protein